MDVKEVLKFTNDLVFSKTGKHLDDLQEAILKGVSQGQKYSKIADDNHCTEGHVRDIASELWQLLSSILGVKVSRSNFQATIKRWQFSIISSNFAKDFTQINNVNVCTDILHFSKLAHPEIPNDDNHRQDTRATKQKDLGDAPDISSFYGRTEELINLNKWILQEKCRLVTILGIVGIGKTALAVKLISQLEDKFDYIFWRSLYNKPSLETIETNLLKFISNHNPPTSLNKGGEGGLLPLTADARRSQLIEYLRKHRCLIILDDVQRIFKSGQLAGHYENEYENYSSLFKGIGELDHNSCVVLLSAEKPREIAVLEGENRRCKSWQLDGLDMASAREILKEKDLIEDEQWETLINNYTANPLWLKIVATMIKDLLSGKVSELIKYDTLFLSEDLKYKLNEQLNHLSELEKQVIATIASEVEPVSISKILDSLQLSPAELLNALQSLDRRLLIAKKHRNNEIFFTLQPVIKQYLIVK